MNGENPNTVKRVVLVIPSLKLGGMERVMAKLVWYFSEQSYLDLHIVMYGLKRDSFYDLPSNITIHKPGFEFDKSRRLWHTAKTVFFLRRKLSSLNADSILSFGEYWNSLVLLSCIGLRLPIFVSDRCQPDKNLGRFQEWLRKWLYPSARGIIAQTPTAKDIYLRIINQPNVQVIGNPIKQILTDEKVVKENIVLTIGRLINTKHHDRLIELFVRINMPGWKLIIVGDDEMNHQNKKRLQELVQKFGAEDKVLLVGKQTDVDNYYTRSKIFAFTSSSEGFPNVVGEAQSAGLPVVAFDCSAGPSDMITDGQNGFLVPLFKYDIFENRLRQLMENEQQRLKFGMAANESVQQFSIERIGPLFERFILTNRSLAGSKIPQPLKVLQVNAIVNTGSTGRITESIGLMLLEKKHNSIIAYGRGNRRSSSQTIKIGTAFSQASHVLKSALLDKHAFGSNRATQKLVSQIEILQPDIIHLHNLHGYYIHIGVLFDYIKTKNIPVVWTLHDCWAFTGHCSYFEFVKCEKWKTECNNCPLYNKYPKSYFRDNSKNNFYSKKELFNGVNNLTLVTPSRWLRNLLKTSFLNNYPVQVIHNGIDLQQFIPLKGNPDEYREKFKLPGGFIILGVASVWDRRKGLNDFIQLSKMIDADDCIVLVGLTKKLMKDLPGNIIGIKRTESIDELVALYNMAGVFINPTWVDNFPTTNIEALACGTPVITYNTGGSVEAVDEATGFVVNKGDVAGLKAAAEAVKQKGKAYYSSSCRRRAEQFFSDRERYTDYIQLYQSILTKEPVIK